MKLAFLLPFLCDGSLHSLELEPGFGELCHERHFQQGHSPVLLRGESLGLVQVGSQALKAQNANNSKRSAKAEVRNDTSSVRNVRMEVVKHLAVVQMASKSSSSTRGVQDFNDGAIVFFGMLFILIIYFVAGAHLGVASDESIESQLQNFYQRNTPWVMPRMEALQELLPCISSNLVGPSADMPLLVPVKALEEREKFQRMSVSKYAGWGSPEVPSDVAWRFDITSMYGQKVLAVQQIKLQDGHLGPVQVLGYRGSGKGKCLGSIDRKLQLVNGEGADFGRLVRKQSGSYELKESATERHRWLVQANMQFPGHEYFTVTWRPRRRLLATLNRGQGSYADYMKVMPTPGVDVVLVILCCVGLFVFRIDEQADGQAADQEDPDADSGSAGKLLESAR